MTISHTTQLPLRGDLRIITRDSSDHSILNVWEKKNVITFVGTEAIIKLLAPNDVLGSDVQLENQLLSMRFGTSNLAPQRTDTSLAAEAVVSALPVRKKLEDADRIIGAAGTLELNAILAAGDGNGVTYREAGLFTRGTDDDPQLTTGEAMFSRQIFSDQPKTGAVELEFRWRITLLV